MERAGELPQGGRFSGVMQQISTQLTDWSSSGMQAFRPRQLSYLHSCRSSKPQASNHDVIVSETCRS